MDLAPFSLNQLLSQKVMLNGESHIRIEFDKPIYENKTFNFAFNKANLDFSKVKSALIQFVDASLNNQPLGYMETHADFTSPRQHIVTYIKPQCNNDCLAVLKYQQIDNQSAVNFQAKLSLLNAYSHY